MACCMTYDAPMIDAAPRHHAAGGPVEASDDALFETVAREPRLSDKVADLMLDRILSRRLEVGDRLPSERELGEQFERLANGRPRGRASARRQGRHRGTVRQRAPRRGCRRRRRDRVYEPVPPRRFARLREGARGACPPRGARRRTRGRARNPGRPRPDAGRPRTDEARDGWCGSGSARRPRAPPGDRARDAERSLSPPDGLDRIDAHRHPPREPRLRGGAHDHRPAREDPRTDTAGDAAGARAAMAAHLEGVAVWWREHIGGEAPGS